MKSSKKSTKSRKSELAAKKGQRCIQGLVLLCLVLVLAHALSLLWQGHVLIEQQQDDFASHHKNNFLHKDLPTTGKKNGAEWIPAKAQLIPLHSTDGEGRLQSTVTTSTPQPLESLRILVAIASYDFSQLPHLEEVLDGYHDVCMTGVAKLDIIVHTTVVYPVAWLDLWRTRFNCPTFSLTFSIQNKNIRLHLVDLHRKLFYEEINNYDLFIYTEDDIRITPTTVATYWQETQTLKGRPDLDYTLFNVGIVRYEYNFPSVIIDDKTRHATEKVTRVYWEHSRNKPILPNAAAGLDRLNIGNGIPTHYIHMRNHHQGMFLATKEHLLRWKELPNCQFHIATRRPGNPNNPRQPLLGTQRVWMSSYQLYEPKYCNIQQILPVERFGALTVHHVPNKNYRRKKGGKTVLEFGNKTDLHLLDQGSPSLVTALQLHLSLAKEYRRRPVQQPYRGHIRIVDQVNHERTPILEKRLKAWQKYVGRRGILSEEDMAYTDLIEWQERLDYMNKMADRKRRIEEIKRRQQDQEEGG